MEASSNAFGWEDEYFRSNGMGQEFLHVKAGGSLHPTTEETLAKGWEAIYQEGKTVFKNAVSEMAFATQEVLRRNDLQPETVDYIIAHQANKRILDGTAKKLGIDPAKVIVTVDQHANTSAASVPLALKAAVDDGRIKSGDLLLMEAMGGGFTWGACLVRY